jgi:hypothetical protein
MHRRFGAYFVLMGGLYPVFALTISRYHFF